MYNLETAKRELCKEIGNHFGAYEECENGEMTVDTGDSVLKYKNADEMLFDWVDTLVEAHKAGEGNWEKEILFIFTGSSKGHPVGIRKINNKKGTVWQAAVDITNPAFPHGKNIYLGSYSSIIDAICARRNFLAELKGVDTTTPEGLEFALRRAKELRGIC